MSIRTVFRWLDGSVTLHEVHNHPPTWRVAVLSRPKVYDLTKVIEPLDAGAMEVTFVRRDICRGGRDRQPRETEVEYVQLAQPGFGGGDLASAIETVLRAGGRVQFNPEDR